MIACPVCQAPEGERCSSGSEPHVLRVAADGERRALAMGMQAFVDLFPEKVREVLSRPNIIFSKSGLGWIHARFPGGGKSIGIPETSVDLLFRYGVLVRKRGSSLNVTDWGKKALMALAMTVKYIEGDPVGRYYMCHGLDGSPWGAIVLGEGSSCRLEVWQEGKEETLQIHAEGMGFIVNGVKMLLDIPKGKRSRHADPNGKPRTC